MAAAQIFSHANQSLGDIKQRMLVAATTDPLLTFASKRTSVGLLLSGVGVPWANNVVPREAVPEGAGENIITPLEGEAGENA